MHPYLKHILEDIANAHCTDLPIESAYKKSFEEETDDIEKWVKGDLNEHTFGYYCGLQPEQFLPVEQLATEEIKLVNEAFKRMMFTYNHDITLPEHLPGKTVYSMLVNTLNEKTFIPKDGFVSFDNCSGYPPDCIFKEHCSCLNIWNSLPEHDTDIFNIETESL